MKIDGELTLPGHRLVSLADGMRICGIGCSNKLHCDQFQEPGLRSYSIGRQLVESPSNTSVS